MPSSRKFLPILSLLLLMMTGCSLTPEKKLPEIPDNPSNQWLLTHISQYKELAESHPSNYKYLKNLIAQREQMLIEADKKKSLVNRHLTLAWDNKGRGGAAMREPAYIHVLNNTKFNDNINPVIQSAKSYSFYELSRWRRYCDSGKGMDEKDWRFVEKEKIVPSDVISDCLPPEYNYQSYLTAWNHFCQTNPLYSELDKSIVKNTSRPFSSNCPALKM